MRLITSYLRHLGLFSLAACASVSVAQADPAQITSQRLMTFPLSFNPSKPEVNFLGNAFATVTANSMTATQQSADSSKLRLSGDPANPTVEFPTTPMAQATITSGPIILAVATAMINIQQIITPNMPVRIASRQSTQVDFPGGPTSGAGMARTRDPFTVGTDGFGGSSLSGGASLSMDFDLLSGGMVPDGSAYGTQEVIFPGMIDDPDTLFDPPPAAAFSVLAPLGAESLFTLTVNNMAGGGAIVTFIPGSPTSPNFTFAYTLGGNMITAGQIQARVLDYLKGGPGNLFSVTATLKGPQNNVTLGNQDVTQSSVPEPASLVLSLVGSGLLVVAIGRQRRR